MSRSKPQPMSSTQANLLLIEVGIVAASAIVTLGGALRGLLKVTKTAEDVKGVAEGAASKL